VALETTEGPVELAPGFLDRADLARSSLYAALRQHYGLRPASAGQTLAAALAASAVALRLGLEPGA
jgi:DNA-binding GntR family transcriptional regulator